MKVMLLIVVFLFVGCSSAPKYKYESQIKSSELDIFMQGKPIAYRPWFDVYLRQGQRNSVLNEMRIGLLAFQNQEYDLAAWLFDRAIVKIETIFANNKTAKKARSKFTSEEVKDFKGDPYERAMVYFYRGLIYLIRDDYENARASMLGGLLQDSLAEDQEYEQDFSSHFYLAAWASHCNGNQSQMEDYYNQAIKYKPYLPKPQPGDNILIVATSGISPIKKRQGKYNEQRYFDSYADLASYQMSRPELQIGTLKIPFFISDNLHWQATTRGGRAIDIINKGKAVFKENSGKAGDSFVQTGNTLMTQGRYSNNKKLGNAGAAFALIGLVSKGISKATTPTADIRYWDNLPSQIYLGKSSKSQINDSSFSFNFIDRVSQESNDYSLKFGQKVKNQLQSNSSCDLIFMTNKSNYLTFRHINQ